MKLHPPLQISSRLLPAVQIGSAWLSIEPGFKAPIFYLDTDGFSYKITGYKPSPISHHNLEKNILQEFRDILIFIFAAVEDDDTEVFERHVLDWAKDHDQEIMLLSMDIDDTLLIDF